MPFCFQICLLTFVFRCITQVTIFGLCVKYQDGGNLDIEVFRKEKKVIYSQREIKRKDLRSISNWSQMHLNACCLHSTTQALRILSPVALVLSILWIFHISSSFYFQYLSLQCLWLTTNEADWQQYCFLPFPHLYIKLSYLLYLHQCKTEL